MSDQTLHPIERIVRYGLSGSLVSLVYSLGVFGFVQILPAIGPVGASILAFCLVQPIGYAIHRTFTFPETYRGASEARPGLRRFILTNLVSLAIAAGGMAFVTDVLRAPYGWGIALNWILIPCSSFLLYRFWVFGRGGRSL